MRLEDLLDRSAAIAAQLMARGEDVAVVESSAGGLISAALLAQPGASAWCQGGAVAYTRPTLSGLLGLERDDLRGLRSATEDYVLLKGRRLGERTGAVWALAESGAAGPTGNRHDPPGHAAIAVVGPLTRARILTTGSDDRLANMHAFAAGALDLMLEVLTERG